MTQYNLYSTDMVVSPTDVILWLLIIKPNSTINIYDLYNCRCNYLEEEGFSSELKQLQPWCFFLEGLFCE